MRFRSCVAEVTIEAQGHMMALAIRVRVFLRAELFRQTETSSIACLSR